MSRKVRVILAELRQHLDALYGARLAHVVLFGSHARGDAEPRSDIDVMVVLKGPFQAHEEIARTSVLTGDISLRYNVVLSRIFISSDRFQSEHSPLLINVRREGVFL